jgi:hypothetical protein
MLSYVADWSSSRCLSIFGIIGSGRTVKTLSALISKRDFLVDEVDEMNQNTVNYLCECTHIRGEDSQHYVEFV